MKPTNFFIVLLFILSIFNFTSHAQEVVMEKNGIKLSSVTDSPAFRDAKLKLLSPTKGSIQDTGKIQFNYELTNYKLSDQTSDAKNKHCSNSAKGQHIHLILNNAPYLAKYETNFSESLKEGNYVALSFLSRSYHESLKHKNAYDLRQFTIGSPANAKKFNLKAPLLFYSRPKSEYIGEDAKKVLLDFYIVNCKLSPKGYKIKATINETEFILTQWTAYTLEGLLMGENTIRLELMDKQNSPVVSDFNAVTRKIILK